jgi:hypothetical protein
LFRVERMADHLIQVKPAPSGTFLVANRTTIRLA